MIISSSSSPIKKLNVNMEGKTKLTKKITVENDMNMYVADDDNMG